jgi:outer membrane protein
MRRTMVSMLLLESLVLALGQAALAQPATKPLSLKEAVELALSPEGNARARLAGQAVQIAGSRASQARAALLPNLDAAITEQDQTRNLAAMGIKFSIPIPGFTFPELVGPFGVFDARATVSQSLFDLSAIRRFQAARSAVRAARSDRAGADESVMGDVTRDYLLAWQAQSRVETVRASVQLAEALLKLSEDQKLAGMGTGIEVTRARVQLANERQRLLVAENQFRAAELRLLKAIGLPLDTRLQLTESFGHESLGIGVEEALAKAAKSRADLQAQRQREETARLNYGAVKWERLPSVVGFGDYGATGTTPAGALATRTFGVTMRVPIFDGGRRDARRAENRLLLEQEKVRTSDLEAQVEMEVRVAFDNLISAEQQIQVAEEGLRLADAELAQAKRRYEAGVTTSLEVTDAQTRFERAQDNRIAALFAFQVAKVDAGLAMGSIEEFVK